MSSIKLKHASGNGVIIAAPSSNPSSDKTINLPSDEAGVFATKNSNDSLQNIAGINGGAIGTKNLIINGGLNVYQRASARAATTQGAGYATADRWKNQWNHLGVTATETVTDLASSDSPYTEGHRKYLRFALASAGTAAVNSYIELSQLVEAQNLATSGWDYTSSSSKITLQFWFRCSTNQTFYCSLQSYDGTVQNYVFPFTASGNNTWTKITHTISGNSNITFNNDNGHGLNIRIIPFYGTSYSGTNVTNNSWVAFNTDYVPDMATTWLTAGASTFDYTAVQLEVGPTASTFVHETYAETLRKCQRYYFQHINGVVNQSVCENAGFYQSSQLFCSIQCPVSMRTEPTMLVSSGTNHFRYYHNNGSAYTDSLNSLSYSNAGKTILMLYRGSLSGTAGMTAILRAGTTDTSLAMSAEL